MVAAKPAQNLVLLPGRLCDARLFEHQIAQLNELASIVVGDLTRSDTFEGMARDVLAAAPDRFTLAGLSLGGIVAFEIVRQAPERVTKLALLDTNPGGNTQENWEEFEASLEMVRAHRLAEFSSKFYYPLMVHPSRRNDPDLQTLVAAMAEAVGEVAFARQVQALKNRSDRWPDLPLIKCPTLIMCGQQDLLCPPALHVQMAAAIESSQLFLIKNCGHLATLEQPVLVTELLQQWLKI